MQSRECGKVVVVGGRGEFGRFLQNEILPNIGVSHLISVDRDTSRDAYLSQLQQADQVILSTPLAGYAEQACELVHDCSDARSPVTLWLVPSVQAHVWRAVSATIKTEANPFVSAVLVHPMYGPNGFRAIEHEAWTYRNILTATIEGDKHPLADKLPQIAAAFHVKFNIPTVSVTPDEHDQITANSQGLSYCVARLMFERPELDELMTLRLPDLSQSFHANHDLILDYLRINSYMPRVETAFRESWTRTKQSSYADILNAFAQADTVLNRGTDSKIPTKWYETLRKAARELGST